MPFLALADVRQTTCHPPSPPRALQFGIIPTCQVLFFPTFHSSMQGVERLSQETRVPLCRIGGKCAAFRAKTVEVSGHLPEQFQLIYYDQLGQGRSTRPASYKGVDMDTWADEADALRAFLGHERIILFGHSFGSFVRPPCCIKRSSRLQVKMGRLYVECSWRMQG
jgi:alpha/beta hydrolase fold